MKKHLKLLLVVICVLLLSTIVAVAISADSTISTDAAFKSYQVATDGGVNLRFIYTDLGTADKIIADIYKPGASEPYATKEYAVAALEAAKAEKGNATYIVSVPLSPDQMDDTVKVYAKDADGNTGKVKAMSVSSYAWAILNSEANASSHNAMRALLNWGAMADQQFNGVANSNINYGLYADGSNPTSGATVSIYNGEDGAAEWNETVFTNVAYNVLLEAGNTRMILDFTYTGSDKLSVSYFKNGDLLDASGIEVIDEAAGKYRANIHNLGVAVFDTEYTIKVTDGTNELSVTKTVLEYLDAIVEGEYTASQKALATSMYQFYTHARNKVGTCEHNEGFHLSLDNESNYKYYTCSKCLENFKAFPKTLKFVSDFGSMAYWNAEGNQGAQTPTVEGDVIFVRSPRYNGNQLSTVIFESSSMGENIGKYLMIKYRATESKYQIKLELKLNNSVATTQILPEQNIVLDEWVTAIVDVSSLVGDEVDTTSYIKLHHWTTLDVAYVAMADDVADLTAILEDGESYVYRGKSFGNVGGEVEYAKNEVPTFEEVKEHNFKYTVTPVADSTNTTYTYTCDCEECDGKVLWSKTFDAQTFTADLTGITSSGNTSMRVDDGAFPYIHVETNGQQTTTTIVATQEAVVVGSRMYLKYRVNNGDKANFDISQSGTVVVNETTKSVAGSPQAGDLAKRQGWVVGQIDQSGALGNSTTGQFTFTITHTDDLDIAFFVTYPSNDIRAKLIGGDNPDQFYVTQSSAFGTYGGTNKRRDEAGNGSDGRYSDSCTAHTTKTNTFVTGETTITTTFCSACLDTLAPRKVVYKHSIEFTKTTLGSDTKYTYTCDCAECGGKVLWSKTFTSNTYCADITAITSTGSISDHVDENYFPYIHVEANDTSTTTTITTGTDVLVGSRMFLKYRVNSGNAATADIGFTYHFVDEAGTEKTAYGTATAANLNYRSGWVVGQIDLSSGLFGSSSTTSKTGTLTITITHSDDLDIAFFLTHPTLETSMRSIFIGGDNPDQYYVNQSSCFGTNATTGKRRSEAGTTLSDACATHTPTTGTFTTEATTTVTHYCSTCKETLAPREITENESYENHPITFKSEVIGDKIKYTYTCNCDECQGDVLWSKVFANTVFCADVTGTQSTGETSMRVDENGIPYVHVDTNGKTVTTVIEVEDVPAGRHMYIKYRANNGQAATNGWTTPRVDYYTIEAPTTTVNVAYATETTADALASKTGWIVGRMNVESDAIKNAGLYTAGHPEVTYQAGKIKLTITHSEDLDIAYFITDNQEFVNITPQILNGDNPDHYYIQQSKALGSYGTALKRNSTGGSSLPIDATACTNHTEANKATLDTVSGKYIYHTEYCKTCLEAYGTRTKTLNPDYIEGHPITFKSEVNGDSTTYTYTCDCSECKGQLLWQKTFINSVYCADITASASTGNASYQIDEEFFPYLHVETGKTSTTTVISSGDNEITVGDRVYLKYRLNDGKSAENDFQVVVKLNGIIVNTSAVPVANLTLEGWAISQIQMTGITSAFTNASLTVPTTAKIEIIFTHTDNLDVAFYLLNGDHNPIRTVVVGGTNPDSCYYTHSATFANQATNTTNKRYEGGTPSAQTCNTHTFGTSQGVEGNYTVRTYYCTVCHEKLAPRDVIPNTVTYYSDVTNVVWWGDGSILAPKVEDGVVFVTADKKENGGRCETTIVNSKTFNEQIGRFMAVKYRMSAATKEIIFDIKLNSASITKQTLTAANAVTDGWVVAIVDVSKLIGDRAADTTSKILIEHYDAIDIAYVAMANDVESLTALLGADETYVYCGESVSNLPSGTEYSKNETPVVKAPTSHSFKLYTKQVGTNVTYTYTCNCAECGGKILWTKTFPENFYCADITSITSSSTATVSMEVDESVFSYAHIETNGYKTTTTIEAENVPVGGRVFMKYRVNNGEAAKNDFQVQIYYTVNGEYAVVGNCLNISAEDMAKREGWVIGQTDISTTLPKVSGTTTAVGDYRDIRIVITHTDPLDVAYFVTPNTLNNDIKAMFAGKDNPDQYYVNQGYAIGTYGSDKKRDPAGGSNPPESCADGSHTATSAVYETAYGVVTTHFCSVCKETLAPREVDSKIYAPDFIGYFADSVQTAGAHITTQVGDNGIMFVRSEANGELVNTAMKTLTGVKLGRYMSIKYRLKDASVLDLHVQINNGAVNSAVLRNVTTDGWVVAVIDLANFKGYYAGAEGMKLEVSFVHTGILDIAYVATADEEADLRELLVDGETYYYRAGNFAATGIECDKSGELIYDEYETQTPVDATESKAPTISYDIDLIAKKQPEVLKAAAKLNMFDASLPLRVEFVHYFEADETVEYSITGYYGEVIRRGTITGAQGEAVKVSIGIKEHLTGYITVKVGDVTDTYIVTPSLDDRYQGDTPFAMDTALTEKDPNSSNADFISKYASAIRLTGVTWIRERANWSWTQYYTEEKGYYFSTGSMPIHVKNQLTAIKGTGLNILGLFGGVPSWSVPADSKGQTGTYATQLQVYEATKWLANTLNGLIDAIELHNEPDHLSFVNTPEIYASWLKAAALGVMDSDSDMAISIAGLCVPYNTTSFTAVLMESDVMNYVSLFNYHAHTSIDKLEGGLDYGSNEAVNTITSALDILGNNKPVWISESGMSIPSTSISDATLRQQAPYIVTGAVQSLSYGVDKYYWFVGKPYTETKDDVVVDFGSFSEDGRAYPTMAAYAVMTSVLGEGKYVGELTGLGDNLRAYLVETGNGDETVAVIWAKTGTAEYTFNSSVSVLKTDMMGQSQTLDPTEGKITVSVTTDPIYITFAGKPDAYHAHSYDEPAALEQPTVEGIGNRVIITPEIKGNEFDAYDKQYGYEISRNQVIDVRVVNLSDVTVSGTVSVDMPGVWTDTSVNVNDLAPHSETTVQMTLTYDTGSSNTAINDLAIFSGEFNGEKTSSTAVHVHNDSSAEEKKSREIQIESTNLNVGASIAKSTLQSAQITLNDNPKNAMINGGIHFNFNKVVVKVNGVELDSSKASYSNYKLTMDLSSITEDGKYMVSVAFVTERGDMQTMTLEMIVEGDTVYVRSNDVFN